jgi:hypothetical protein
MDGRANIAPRGQGWLHVDAHITESLAGVGTGVEPHEMRPVIVGLQRADARVREKNPLGVAPFRHVRANGRRGHRISLER